MKSDTHMPNGPFRMHAAAKQMHSSRQIGPWKIPLNYSVGIILTPSLLYEHAFTTTSGTEKGKHFEKFGH